MSIKNILKMYVSTKRLPSMIQTWNAPKVSLDAAGLVALADFTTIAKRTAFTGTSALLDVFVLCPGLHRQQSATELNGGEYPAVAAMTSGYVFRVENPATVLYLQKVGLTGQLTTLSVTRISDTQRQGFKLLSTLYAFSNASITSALTYLGAVCMTMTVLVLLVLSEDWWGLFVIFLLMFARLCNVVIIRRRSQVGWKGAREPGVKGDLLILLSQDRWIRMRGLVDDLKAVTSGQWLRDPSFAESSFTALGTVLVYLDAVLASNVSQSGKILLLALLIGSVGLLAIANESTEALQMHGNIIMVDGPRRQYGRRLEMAEELIKESGREDWAVRLGMIVPKVQGAANDKTEGPVTM